MIPKTIHYCWFGRGEKSKLMKKCIRSWKKHCPDYEIIEWNEDNFDVNSTLWTKQAYETKKYAFVADFARLWVLYTYGGVYMDTDQEVIKPLYPFLEHDGFIGFLNEGNQLSMGLFGVGAIGAGHDMIGELLDYYFNRPFLTEAGNDMLPNTDIVTAQFIQKGLVLNDQRQDVSGFAIYPPEYFCPTSCVSIHDCKSKETVAIHHWAMTWRKKSEIANFKRVKWHQTKTYTFLIWLRYLPNRAVRKIFGDEKIDGLKKKLGKGT